MKIRVDIDCAPLEAVLAEMQGRMKDAVAGADLDARGAGRLEQHVVGLLGQSHGAGRR